MYRKDNQIGYEIGAKFWNWVHGTWEGCRISFEIRLYKRYSVMAEINERKKKPFSLIYPQILNKICLTLLTYLQFSKNLLFLNFFYHFHKVYSKFTINFTENLE